MQSRITITLKEYFDGGYELPENINNFIELEIADTTYNVKELFIKRNMFKEIGSETQDLFKHNLEVLIDEALIIYNPQLKLLQDNYENLMKRTTKETISGSGSRGSTNKNFLNPANTDASKLTDKNTNETENEFEETRDRSFGFFKSNPEILKVANDCFDVVMRILEKLDRAFIGEY